MSLHAKTVLVADLTDLVRQSCHALAGDEAAVAKLEDFYFMSLGQFRRHASEPHWPREVVERAQAARAAFLADTTPERAAKFLQALSAIIAPEGA